MSFSDARRPQQGAALLAPPGRAVDRGRRAHAGLPGTWTCSRGPRRHAGRCPADRSARDKKALTAWAQDAARGAATPPPTCWGPLTHPPPSTRASSHAHTVETIDTPDGPFTAVAGQDER
ncbi:hypothetical protein QJS66_13440 [Kocuria rhizophila]|nr:hypothetical protein QJS66_13440 [Kocuria rhizophila]